MTERDVYLDEMGLLRDIAALDRVLQGGAGFDDAPISRFVHDLRESFPAAAVPADVEGSHLAAIVAAAAETSITEVVLVPSRFARLRSSLAARVGALTLVASSGLTGAAYAGVLPASVQRAVSDAAGSFGLDLPHPDDDLRAEDSGGKEATPVSERDEEEPEDRGGPDPSTGSREQNEKRGPASAGTAGEDREAREAKQPEATPGESVEPGDRDSENSGGSEDSSDSDEPDDYDDLDGSDGSEGTDNDEEDGVAEAEPSESEDAEELDLDEEDEGPTGDDPDDTDIETDDYEAPSELDD
jgi:hypothetical protein